MEVLIPERNEILGQTVFVTIKSSLVGPMSIAIVGRIAPELVYLTLGIQCFLFLASFSWWILI